jgi:MFS family permease
MVVMSRCQGFILLLIFFALSGVGSGLANIPMMALTAPWYHSDQRGKATGIVICGNGLGIILAGSLVPRFNRIYGMQGWRAGWLTLGLIALAVAITAGLLLRNHPLDLGLKPLGRGPLAAQGPVQDLAQQRAQSESGAGKERSSRGVLVRLSLLYLAFGLTSSVYGTFIVTSMIHEYGLSERTAGFYWSWVGLCSLFSGVGFGTLSDRIGRNYGLAVVFGVHTVAYLLAGLKLGTPGLIVSIVLFGLSIFGAPAVVTAALGDHFSASTVARALSIATLLFAVGQTIGPVAAAAMAGPRGIFTVAYLAAALVTAAAALFALTLPALPKSAHL